MSGFLLLLAMGAVAWYAWPAAPSFTTKVWTIFFALFLAPFSWPWLIARGHRARKAVKASAARQETSAAEELRHQNIEWWVNEFDRAYRAGDHDTAKLADETLKAMGHTQRWEWNGTSTRNVRWQ